MATKAKKPEPEEDLPICGICEQPMVRLSKTTAKKNDPIYVCNKGTEKSKMPCDGFAFQIALKNS